MAQDCSAARPQFNLAFLFTAMFLVALWSLSFWGTTTGSKVVLAVYALTYLCGCWKTRRAVLCLLPAMYLPYAWLLAASHWDGYRLQWVAMVWQLPGILAEVLFHPLDGWLFQVVTAVATLMVFFIAIIPARFSFSAASKTSLVVFAAALLNSWLCYQLFRL